MNDLLKEFEDDMRREQREAAWKNFGKYAVWMSIAIVLGTAGGVSWRYYQKSQAEKATAVVINGQELLALGDYKQAVQTLGEQAKKANAKLHGITALNYAQALHESGDEKAAKQSYASLSEQSSGAYSALASIASAPEDKVIPTPKKGEAFYHSKMEWRGWQLLKQDKKEEASNIFAALLDDDATPQTMRGRVTDALQLTKPAALLPKKEGADAK